MTRPRTHSALGRGSGLRRAAAHKSEATWPGVGSSAPGAPLAAGLVNCPEAELPALLAGVLMLLLILMLLELDGSTPRFDLEVRGSCVVNSSADHQSGGTFGVQLVPLVLLPDLNLERDQARDDARLYPMLGRALHVLSKIAATIDGATGCLREANDQARSMHWEDVSCFTQCSR